MSCLKNTAIYLGIVSSFVTASALSATNDKVAMGARLYNERCTYCHSTKEGVNKIGPTLNKVVGRHSGSVSNYSYSSSTRSLDLTWTDEVLARFISGPQAMIPCHQIATKTMVICPGGTKMTFSGFRQKANAEAVVEYLKAQ